MTPGRMTATGAAFVINEDGDRGRLRDLSSRLNTIAAMGDPGGLAGKRLFVCFFGDGPKWHNFVLTLALPPGLSNVRPFRYGDNRIAPDVLAELDAEGGIERVKQLEATLAVRFGTNPYTPAAFHSLVLPLREVTVTFVDRAEGNNSVYFRGGALYDYPNGESPLGSGATIPDEELAELGTQVILFASDLPLPQTPAAEDEQGQREAWTRLTSLIATPGTPVNPDAKRATFIRFGHPRTGTEAATPDRVFDSSVEGPRYGWNLSESKSYEMAWDHRVPCLVGTTHGFPFIAEKPAATSNLELGLDQDAIGGNYERHSLPLTARSPSGTVDSLRLSPDAESVQATDGGPVNAVEVRALIGVKKNLWYRTKRSVASIGALSIVTAAALLGDQIADKGLGSVWSLEGLKVFLAAAIPIGILKVVEEHFRQ